MKNVTLAVEEKLLEESREYARRHHTTLNAMVRKLLQREVGAQAAETHWVEQLSGTGRKAAGILVVGSGTGKSSMTEKYFVDTNVFVYAADEGRGRQSIVVARKPH